eukprot:917977-Pleurochrysis_carterae.AAC.3
MSSSNDKLGKSVRLSCKMNPADLRRKADAARRQRHCQFHLPAYRRYRSPRAQDTAADAP